METDGLDQISNEQVKQISIDEADKVISEIAKSPTSNRVPRTVYIEAKHQAWLKASKINFNAWVREKLDAVV